MQLINECVVIQAGVEEPGCITGSLASELSHMSYWFPEYIPGYVDKLVVIKECGLWGQVIFQICSYLNYAHF